MKLVRWCGGNGGKTARSGLVVKESINFGFCVDMEELFA